MFTDAIAAATANMELSSETVRMGDPNQMVLPDKESLETRPKVFISSINSESCGSTSRWGSNSPMQFHDVVKTIGLIMIRSSRQDKCAYRNRQEEEF